MKHKLAICPSVAAKFYLFSFGHFILFFIFHGLPQKAPLFSTSPSQRHFLSLFPRASLSCSLAASTSIFLQLHSGLSREPAFPQNKRRRLGRAGGCCCRQGGDSPAPCPRARLELALPSRRTKRCLVEPQKHGRELTGMELAQRCDTVWESWRCSGGTSEREPERRAEASGDRKSVV